jgi:hypothetical protein
LDFGFSGLGGFSKDQDLNGTVFQDFKKIEVD